MSAAQALSCPDHTFAGVFNVTYYVTATGCTETPAADSILTATIDDRDNGIPTITVAGKTIQSIQTAETECDGSSDSVQGNKATFRYGANTTCSVTVVMTDASHFDFQANFGTQALGTGYRNVSYSPPPPVLSVEGPAELARTIEWGGAPAAGTYTIRNTGGSTLNWTASGSFLVTLSQGQGSLAPGASYELTVTFNTGFASATGTYTSSISFGGNGGTDQRSVNLTITKAATAVQLAFNPDPSIVGTGYGVTATVTTANPTAVPTGTVTVTTDQGPGCTITLASGTGSCPLSVGSPPLVLFNATYSGDNFFASSTVGPVSHSITNIPTTAAISSVPSPIVHGGEYRLIAQLAAVAPGTGVPTGGSVTFRTGATDLCSAVLQAGGAAACTILASQNTRPAGSLPVTAIYSGAGNFAGSTTSTDLTIAKSATTTSISNVSPAASTIGGTYTVTALVSSPQSGFHAITGTITISDGTTMCEATIANFRASCDFVANAIGTITLTATYNGDGNYLDSTSEQASHGVRGATTTTIIGNTPNPTVTGQPYTVTVKVAPVAPATGMPTGTVTLSDGETTLPAVSLVDGQVTANFSTAGVNAHTLTAIYSGDGAFFDSLGNAAHVVDRGAVSVTGGATPEPSSTGQPYTVSVTVAPVSPAAGTPGGVVTVSDGSLNCEVTLAGGAGSCAMPGGAPAGSRTLTLAYGGDARFEAGSHDIVHGVETLETTTSVIASPNPSVFGTSVTLKATVASGQGTPAGTVTFKEGDTVLAAAVALTGNTASFSTSALPAGSHTITAVYSGDGSFDGSSGSTELEVNQATTTTGLAASPNPSVFGTEVTLTATVATDQGTPTGTVTFKEGNTVLAAGVALTGNTASFSTSALPAGSHTITAVYSGGGSFAGSSGSVPLQVDQATTTTGLVASPNPSVFGTSVTLKATVASGQGTPTGTVTFKEGDTVLAADVALAGNTASFSTSALPAGPHTITAVYSGDGAFLGSSGSVPLQVNQATTTTTITDDAPDPSTFGQPYTVTVEVKSDESVAAVPTGSVIIRDGVTACPPQTVPASGIVSCIFTSTPVGTAMLTATYSGDAAFAGSVDTEAHTISAIPTSTALMQSAPSSVIGSPVTLTATVNPSSATGSVTFLDTSNPIGTAAVTGGIATLVISTLGEGDHELAAVYSGDGQHSGSTSSPVIHSVVARGSITLEVETTDGDGSFAFSSSAPELSTVVLTSGGAGQSSAISLPAGTYTVGVSPPAGFGITSVVCSDSDSRGDAGRRAATIVLAAAESVTCRFTSVNSRKKTVEVISQFLQRRADLLLSSGPDTDRQIDRLLAAGQQGAESGGGSGFADAGRPSIATSADAVGMRMLGGQGSRASTRTFEERLAEVGGSSRNSGLDEPADAARGTAPFAFAGGNESGARISFATSLSQVLKYNGDADNRKIGNELAGAGLKDGSLPTGGAPFMPLDVWVEANYSDFSDDRGGVSRSDSGGHFGIVYVGADYVLSPALLVGVLAQYDSMELTSDRGAYSVEGHGWMVGPYATARLGENVFLQGRAAWGTSQNKISPYLTYTDEFSSERWLVSSTLSGAWSYAEWNFRPAATIAYIEDGASAYTDSLGVIIPGVGVALGQMKAGPAVSYRYEMSGGTVLSPSLGLEAIWNFESSDDAADFGGTLAGGDGVRGRIEAGLKGQFSSGWGVDMSLAYDGIGSSSYHATTGKLTIGVPLD